MQYDKIWFGLTLTGGNAERGGMELGSADYALIGGDLRHWDNIANRLAYHGFQSE